MQQVYEHVNTLADIEAVQKFFLAEALNLFFPLHLKIAQSGLQVLSIDSGQVFTIRTVALILDQLVGKHLHMPRQSMLPFRVDSLPVEGLGLRKGDIEAVSLDDGVQLLLKYLLLFGIHGVIKPQQLRLTGEDVVLNIRGIELSDCEGGIVEERFGTLLAHRSQLHFTDKFIKKLIMELSSEQPHPYSTQLAYDKKL